MLGLARPKFRFTLTRYSLIATLSAIFLAYVYFWRLGSLTPGLSPTEAGNINLSHSLHSIYHHPLNAPHNLLIYALLKVHYAGFGGLRAVSAAFTLVFVGCFYKIVRSWFGVFIGWLGTLLMATTPLVILAGHSASADIMYLAILVPAAIYFWLMRSKNASKLAYLSLFATSALCIYTPGLIWILIAALIIVRPSLYKLASTFPRWLNASGITLFLAILAPLIISLAHWPHTLRELFLIPANHDVLSLLKATGWMAVGLVWHTAKHDDLQIARLPLMSVSQLILVVFGTYAFWLKARSKVYGLAGLLILSIVGAGFSGSLGLLLLGIAALSIVITAGLRYLLLEWQTVFPLNPLPRGLALTLISCAVAINVFYGVRYSLVAWPHAATTKQVYVVK